MITVKPPNGMTNQEYVDSLSTTEKSIYDNLNDDANVNVTLTEDKIFAHQHTKVEVNMFVDNKIKVKYYKRFPRHNYLEYNIPIEQWETAINNYFKEG